jgi:hypothetical protein
MKKTYCWFQKCREDLVYNERFSTIKEAKNHSHKYNRDGKIICIARCEYADPAGWVPSDIDAILEEMDRIYKDSDEICVEQREDCDVIFDIATDQREAAATELAKFLECWARKYVKDKSGYWHVGKVVKEFTAPANAKRKEEK